MFAIQSDVANRVTEAVRVTLRPNHAQQLKQTGTDSIEAYDFYLQGLYQQNTTTPEGLLKSLELFGHAIEKDPRFARAHAAIGVTYDVLGGWGIQHPREALPKGKAAALRALELDDSIIEAHTVVGDLATYDLEWPVAEAGYKRALALNPNSALALDSYGTAYFLPQGRFEESIATIRRAIELDPNSLVIRTDLALALHLARRPDEAITEAKRVLAREPTATQALWILGLAYWRKGAFDASIEALEKRAVLTKRIFLSLGGLGFVYAHAGKSDSALKILAEMNERAKNETADPIGFAGIYLGLGDNDNAMKWLENGYDERPNGRLAFVKVGTFYDSLQSDPRYMALLKKIGLEK